MNKLHKKLTAISEGFGENLFKDKVKNHIYDNLRYGSKIRPYQKEAFGRFIYYINDYQARPKGVPTQLLYHMATGSGKTLIMAGIIIEMYNRGYRNFLFFVNNTNIIEKTRDNFLNPNSSKYLFSENITIGGKQIRIKEVDNFQSANQDDINIVFSTVQMLHFRLNMPRENSVTYDDFEDKKIVLISDEAHHINAETKKASKLNKEEILEIQSWENTVNRIFNSNNNNLLLEFTATADLSDPNIMTKYENKLIYDYPLSQFRIDGYSKEVKILQADLEPFERALQGLILSQYRRKIFEKNKLKVKPVILFKSKTIGESEQFFQEFLIKIKKLKVNQLERIFQDSLRFDINQISLKYGSSNGVLIKAFQYFKSNNISLESLVEEFQNDFDEPNCIIVNSKNDSEAKQLAVNSLEDENNEFRAVFTVNMLNEGWDVLNLFDIVRLFDTRDFNASTNKPGKTTTSEAQLIGRGARYFPFQIEENTDLYKRKFDFDVENELKICEELYYHSAHNPKYIVELNWALEEVGIKPKKVIEKELKLKETFTESNFYKTALVYLNDKIKYNGSDIFSLDNEIGNHEYKFHLRTGSIQTTVIYEDPTKQKNKLKTETRTFSLIDFGIHIIRKAIDKLDFYRFDNLQYYLVNLSSISEFITSENYLGKIKNIKIEGTKLQLDNILPEEKLRLAISILGSIEETLKSSKIEYKGSKEFTHYFLKDKLAKSKKLNFAADDSPDKETGKSIINPSESNLYLDISQKDWFVYEDSFGTSEEKHFIHFIDKTYEKLKKKYSEIYLVRNERFFKIYNFEDGRATEPDFVLYLVNHNPENSVYYQIFVEPKGDQFKDSQGKYENSQEGWKEKFLISLKAEHKIEILWKEKEYIIWGMPFYNKVLEVEFEETVKNLLL
ncbi:MAG: DEAD/DEAH box helicase family protein [Ignavibacteriales bacterium]|nr:DEAD/DEAH box helicase family protein [Ignavibacteriales bacterium]